MFDAGNGSAVSLWSIENCGFISPENIQEVFLNREFVRFSDIELRLIVDNPPPKSLFYGDKVIDGDHVGRGMLITMEDFFESFDVHNGIHNTILSILKEPYPKYCRCFVDNVLCSVTFNQTEITLMRELLDEPDFQLRFGWQCPCNAADLSYYAKELEMNDKEVQIFKEKLELKDYNYVPLVELEKACEK